MDHRHSDCDEAIAACVTPAAVGGVAVIQVVGSRAPAIVESFLRARHDEPLATWDDETLRLCRWVDGDQVIDDVVATIRRSDAGQPIVDLSLHGGTQVVQRSLAMLQRAGARIVEPGTLFEHVWPGADRCEREILPAMLRVKTRAVASWLTRMPQRLTRELGRVIDAIEADRPGEAKARLARLRDATSRIDELLDGVRVVLFGQANVGKSTLANGLAARSESIVSKHAGTTRDWVAHDGAIDGVPVTIVDTAGVRPTDDPIEQEAVRRSWQQASQARVLVRVMDQSATPAHDDRLAPDEIIAECRKAHAMAELLVWNKADLPAHPQQAKLIQGAGPRGCTISAATGDGLDDLKRRLIEVLGLTDWRERIVGPISLSQRAACDYAANCLTNQSANPGEAARTLRAIIAVT